MTVLSVAEAHQVLDEIERAYHEGASIPVTLTWTGSGTCAAGWMKRELASALLTSVPTLVREWRATLAVHYPTVGFCSACFGVENFDAIPVDWPCREVTSVLACLEPFRSLTGDVK